MNKIIDVAKRHKEILAESAGKEVCCPSCSEQWFSPFDKLYVAAYGKCFSCDDKPENSENIFAIIEAL